MSSQFVHLHFHTHYSLLDGAIKVKGLGKKLDAMGYQACAITDHGNMFGAIEFHHELKKAGLKPIIGMEAYVAMGHRTLSKYDRPGPNAFHAVLLAQNKEGYKNLCKLSSRAFVEGKFYGRARLDRELLEQYNSGIIALSACLQGELAKRLGEGNRDDAFAAAAWYKEVFAGRYYVELQANGLPQQDLVNPQLIQIARELGLPLVGTNDCHYPTQDLAEAHYLLQLMGWQKRVTDPGVKSLETSQLYIKNPEEMAQAFANLPSEALSNTGLIAAQCELDLNNKTFYLPDYPASPGRSLDEELMFVAREGLQARLQALTKLYAWADPETAARPYRERLEFEMNVINQMGFPGYFLIVSDFINWAKNNGVPVGPGRGSGAGSLVAYAMNITDLDPIRYELLFERFLNPDRISLPDFDIDFEVEGRERVIDYVRKKYGEEKVCQISAIGSLMAKGVFRGVARVLDIPFGEADQIARLIPEELGITLAEAIEREPKLKEMAEKGSELEKKWIRSALALEGLNNNLSTHAAGVIIMNSDVTDVMPVCTPTKGEGLQSQYTMKYAEDQGAVKFDFLGLKNLTVIHRAVELINRGLPAEQQINISFIPLDDAKTYQLLSRGDTTGVFQLESGGMKALIQKLRPDCFEDIIALVALYRPGPLGSGMVDDFVECKHGRKAIVYMHPKLEEVLKETYGVMVYQEQVMKVVQVLAGFSLGQADLLRRAIGKKIPEVLAEQRQIFVEGCAQHGVEPAKAGEIFDLIDYFAGYGFNKSHSAAYALVSYQTAWLKANFPVEFMAALLTSEMNKPEAIVKLIHESREMKIAVLPPDVNDSDLIFTTKEGKIRFGLNAIKNVGASALSSILEARSRAGGRFPTLSDIFTSIDSSKVNSRVMEALVKAGVFDSLLPNRRRIYESIESLLGLAQAEKSMVREDQVSLFDALPAAELEKSKTKVELPPVADWKPKIRLKFEKEALGFYISGHPAAPYLDEFKELTPITPSYEFKDEDCQAKLKKAKKLRLAGVIASSQIKMTKGNKYMAILQVEDPFGSLEVVIFPKLFPEVQALLDSEDPLLFTGRLNQGNGGISLAAEKINSLPALRAQYAGLMTLNLEPDQALALSQLEALLPQYPGHCLVRLNLGLHPHQVVVQLPGRVNPSERLVESLEEVAGMNHLRFRIDAGRFADPAEAC